MDENDIVSLPDDNTLREENILVMLRYSAIYDALYCEETSVNEALKRASKKKYIHPSTGKVYTFSLRTLYRYLSDYKKFAINGLVRSSNKNKGRPKAIPEDLVGKILSLKLELPVRSARKIIVLLELAGEVDKGLLKERTVSRLLQQKGYTRKALKAVKQHYQKLNVDKIYDLYVSDIKEFWIRDENGNSYMIYLFIVMDCFSRRIIHAQFYTDGILLRLEDCFKKALVKFGKCSKFYVDNGSVYIANNFKYACASLGIKIIYASRYYPQGKGVVERFIRSCSEDFLSELRINPMTEITKLNESLFGWIEDEYHNDPHEGIKKQTPLEAWNKSLADGASTVYFSPIELTNAFYHHVERKVSPYGVISFETNTYEVDVSLIGETVQVRYDPLDLSNLFIYHKKKFVCVGKPIDLTREQHSQYKNVKMNSEFDPVISIDYPELMAKQHRKMIEKLKDDLVKGNNTPDITENVCPVSSESDTEMARPGHSVQEKTIDMKEKTYLDIVKDFLDQEFLTFQQKELLNRYYNDFKIFNDSLFKKTLNNLGSQFPDSKDNLLFYLNTIKNELDKE